MKYSPVKFLRALEDTEPIKAFLKSWFFKIFKPNILTAIRIGCAILNIFFLFYYSSFFFAKAHFDALIATVVAGVSDLLDGPSARINRLVSTFGAMFDRIADKIFDLVMQKSVWIFSPLLSVSWFITESILIWLAKKEKKYQVDVKSGDVGKCKTFIRYVAYIIFELILSTEGGIDDHPVFYWIGILVYSTSMLFAIGSISFHHKKIRIKRASA